MSELANTLLTQFQQNNLLELTAVLLAIAYLLLAVRQHLACWYAAFVSTAIYLYVFYSVNLYMESALQVFYMAMAVYGWHQWRQGGAGTNPVKGDNPDKGASPNGNASLAISTWPLRHHLIAISLVLAATIISGTLLAGTEQHLRYVDSFTTWGAVVTTYMVTRKILENWLYWLVIDGVAIFLYLDRALYFTALLFVIYEVIVIFGWLRWLKDYRRQQQAT